jgi:hypothetical protein
VERALSLSERQELRQAVGAELHEVVQEAAGLADRAELELYAGLLVPPAAIAEGPPGAVEELLSLIGEARGGRRVLRAMAVSAPPPVAQLALEAAGPLGDAAEAFGRLTPERAWAIDGGEDVASLLVTCRRPGAEGLQLFAFTIEREISGGALKDGFATPTVAEQNLDEIVSTRAAGLGIEPEALSTEDAIERLAAAAQRSAEVGLGPPPETLPALALLLRAAGVPGAEDLLAGLVGLALLAEELDADPDEERIADEIEALALELRGWCAARGLEFDAAERTEWVGGLMADYRAWHADGRLTAWNATSLTEFLLDWIPRKVDVPDEDVPHFAPAAAEVLRFLGGTGRLPSKRAEMLARRAVALGVELKEAVRDPTRYGPAKGMALAMAADGVDLTDQEAVQAWIDGFNARTRKEREEIVPALTSLSGGPSSSRPRRKTEKARKAKKRARRRNRRH